MSTTRIQPVFIGGYTKSGTTFIGRAFDILSGVYARGEMDYFRLMYGPLTKSLIEFNRNIQIVNREVYDERGTLEPLTNTRTRAAHQRLFADIFFNGAPPPADCRVMVEKSPRNIFHIDDIRYVFPAAPIVCVFRDPVPVYRSLLRHMADHRDTGYRDPQFKGRKHTLERFTGFRWPKYADILEKQRDQLIVVRYDKAAEDPGAFVDFAETRVIGQKLGRDRGIETLSKDYYLSTLPEDVRARSLVQADSAEKITVSEEEIERLTRQCRIPDISFDF